MNAHLPNDPAQSLNPLVRLGRAFLQWFDTSRSSSFDTDAKAGPGADRIDWVRTLPFILMHLLCLFVFVVGVRPIALIV
jgi:stearoyl-CoA desaturase (delta-9 desaturase)